MFYMFHHLPKCGGSSFRQFLEGVFTIHHDYIGRGGPIKNPKRMAQYLRNVPDLSKLSETDCLAGHYRQPGTNLRARYPDLENHAHRKFSIIRDPFETARSGVYFGIQRGRIPADLTPAKTAARILERSAFLSRTLGIRAQDEIDVVLNRYWFIAPLDRIDDAARVIETTTGRRGPPVGRIKITEKRNDPLPAGLEAEFREKAALDYAVFERAVARFDAFYRAAKYGS